MRISPKKCCTYIFCNTKCGEKRLRGIQWDLMHCTRCQAPSNKLTSPWLRQEDCPCHVAPSRLVQRSRVPDQTAPAGTASPPATKPTGCGSGLHFLSFPAVDEPSKPIAILHIYSLMRYPNLYPLPSPPYHVIAARAVGQPSPNAWLMDATHGVYPEDICSNFGDTLSAVMDRRTRSKRH